MSNTQKDDIFSWEKVPINNSDIKILEELLKENNLNEKTLTKKTELAPSTISKSLKKLGNIHGIGLVTRVRDIPIFFTLNQNRIFEIKQIITSFEYGKNNPLLLSGHATVYELEVNELPERFLKHLEEDKEFTIYNPNNWKGCKKKDIDGSVSFHKTNKGCKMLAYFKVFGADAHIMDMITKDKLARLINQLEEKYPRLKIGGAEKIAECNHKEYAWLRDSYSVKAIKLGIKHKKVEDSLKIGGEFEVKGFNTKKECEKHEKNCEGDSIPDSKKCPICGTKLGFVTSNYGSQKLCSSDCKAIYKERYGDKVLEWKCKCNSCGHTWHYLDSVEKELKSQATNNALVGVGMCCNPFGAIFSNKSIDLQRQIKQLEQCPKCGSSNVKKESTYFKK